MHKIIHFPKINDPRGNLSFIEYPMHLPFKMKRVFWMYDVPSGESRGGHAYYEQEEVIIALSGSFEVILTNRDGTKEKIVLNRSHSGLYISPNTWRHMENFSTNSLALHLSGSIFNEGDYIREFEKFIKL
jgi:oxalate decarboxylase/phosphoglucose isomerase-like protein (cupin superfamily)